MKVEPLVTVVIPTRDRNGLVPRAVASVVRQTYRNLEVLVIDDGSGRPVELPDALLDDPRVSLTRVERSVGSGPARDLALDRANGDLLAFCDDDDEWLPRKTQEQVRVLQDEPGAIAVESGYELREGGRLVYRYLPARRDAFRTLLERPIMAPTVVMTRTAAVHDAGGFGPLERHHDWDLWLRLTAGRRVIALPRFHAIRRDHAPVPFDLQLELHRTLLANRIAPALAGLSPVDRSRILGFHYRVMGMLAARAGRRDEARRLLLDAWRERPTDVGSLVRLLRTVMGEREWQAMTGIGEGVERVLRRATGRDPFLRRF